jgi:hypothetical protein
VSSSNQSASSAAATSQSPTKGIKAENITPCTLDKYDLYAVRAHFTSYNNFIYQFLLA